MFKKIVVLFSLFISTSLILSAQAASIAELSAFGSNTSEAANLQLAISNPEYPVTQGDIYRLAYRSTTGSVVTMEVLIDATGYVSLGVFGKIDAKGLTFVELKKKAEDLISKNYAHSIPELTILTPGVFQITIRGGNPNIQYATVWGLTRLSEIAAKYNNISASVRNIGVISQSGTQNRYDLMAVESTSGKNIDPLVKPGDTIVLYPTGRSITLAGEVRKPGTYELTAAENLKTLIEIFGGGLTNKADPNRVRINHASSKGERIEYITLPGGYSAELTLQDGDTVLVRGVSEQLSVVWFEGAVLDPASSSQTASAQGMDISSVAASLGLSGLPSAGTTQATSGQANSSNRFSYQIREGQKLSDVLQDVRAWFLPMADLGFASYYESGALKSAAIDIPSLLSGSDMSTDLVLTPGAKIVIPSVSVSVMVSGAVYIPGSIQYRPNSPAEYYMIQAGGIDPWRNSFGSYTLRDKFGNKRKASEPIQPGDEIHVNENNFFYQLERRVPVLASILALTTSIVTLTLVYGQ